MIKLQKKCKTSIINSHQRINNHQYINQYIQLKLSPSGDNFQLKGISSIFRCANDCHMILFYFFVSSREKIEIKEEKGKENREEKGRKDPNTGFHLLFIIK